MYESGRIRPYTIKHSAAQYAICMAGEMEYLE